MSTEKEKQGKKKKAAINAALAGAMHDTVDRHGAAIKEHIVAYTGFDNETGTKLTRSLRDIANYKRADESDPNYYAQTKQQAGFAAEVKHTARQRAEQAAQGKKPTTMRTDDIPGHVNDQIYDITDKVDVNGNPVSNASYQMKFVGNSPKEAVALMMSGKYEKYFDHNAKMLVPKDFYDEMVSDLDERVQKLKEQCDRLKKTGDIEKLKAKQLKLKKVAKIKKSLRKSNTSNKDAIEARNSPIRSMAKDIRKNACRAGVDAAIQGAAIGGMMAVVRNFIDVYNGDKKPKKTVKDVGWDTLKTAGRSGATGAAGAVIKGFLQNSKKQCVRALSKTNFPANIVNATIEVGMSLKAYHDDKINGEECMHELAEKGCSSLCAAMCGAVVVGGPPGIAFVASMVAYSLGSSAYKILKESLQDAKHAREERIRIERECDEAINLIRESRARMEKIINDRLLQDRILFNQAFVGIKESLEIGDVDGYISSMNSITVAMGGKPQFANMKEFDEIMMSEASLII